MVMQIIVGIQKLVGSAKGHLTQQENANIVGLAGEAVVGAFADHICKVHSLTEPGT